MKVYATAYHNLIPNMATVKTHFADVRTHWDAKDFYNACYDMSYIFKMALPVVAEEEE